jgi:hypothetical protein
MRHVFYNLVDVPTARQEGMAAAMRETGTRPWAISREITRL